MVWYNDKNADSIYSLDKSLHTKCMMSLMTAFIKASFVDFLILCKVSLSQNVVAWFIWLFDNYGQLTGIFPRFQNKLIDCLNMIQGVFKWDG